MITSHVITPSVPAAQRPTASIVAHRINHLSDILEAEVALLKYAKPHQREAYLREIATTRRQLAALRRRYNFISNAS